MRLFITGSVAFDRIMAFPGRFAELIQPDKLHAISISVLLDELQDSRGGVAANIAYNLGLLGERPVLLASVGSDQNSQKYMTDLSQQGVDIEHIHYSEKPTATATIMTDRDDCQVAGFYPGAMLDARALSLRWHVTPDAFVVISPHDIEMMRQQVEECRVAGQRFFYDVGQQLSNLPDEDIRAGVEAAELVIVNDYELGLMEKKTGWSLAELRSKIAVLVVTLGAAGCVIYSKKVPGGEEKVSAVPVEKVVDPTGAGDAFRSGFLYGYVRDWPLARCAQLAAATANYAITQFGTQNHTFTLESALAKAQAHYQVPSKS